MAEKVIKNVYGGLVARPATATTRTSLQGNGKVYTISPGWNYISFPKNTGDSSIASIFQNNPEIVKIQTDGMASVKNSDGDWVGSVERVYKWQGYKIKSDATEDTELTVMGETHWGKGGLLWSSLNLNKGNNLISMPFTFDAEHEYNLNDVFAFDNNNVTLKTSGTGAMYGRGNITFTDAGGADVGDTVILIGNGTSSSDIQQTITYTAGASEDLINNQWNQSGDRDANIASLKACIEHANGHNGAITMTTNSTQILLNQAVNGTDGNTAVTVSGTNLGYADFTGGLPGTGQLVESINTDIEASVWQVATSDWVGSANVLRGGKAYNLVLKDTPNDANFRYFKSIPKPKAGPNSISQWTANSSLPYNYPDVEDPSPSVNGPGVFTFNQESSQCFGLFPNLMHTDGYRPFYGMHTNDDPYTWDWIGAFKGDTCVGSCHSHGNRNWETGDGTLFHSMVPHMGNMNYILGMGPNDHPNYCSIGDSLIYLVWEQATGEYHQARWFHFSSKEKFGYVVPSDVELDPWYQMERQAYWSDPSDGGDYYEEVLMPWNGFSIGHIWGANEEIVDSHGYYKFFYPALVTVPLDTDWDGVPSSHPWNWDDHGYKYISGELTTPGREPLYRPWENI